DIDELEIDAGDLNVKLRLLEFGRQLHAGGDLLVENGGLGQFLFEFGLGNDFRGLLERRRDDREPDWDGFPVEHEANLELDGAEIRVINDDALLLNLHERERPRRDARDEHFVEDVDGDGRRRGLHLRRTGRGIHEPDVVKLVITDEGNGRQQQRFIRASYQPPRWKGWPAQRGFDVGVA